MQLVVLISLTVLAPINYLIFKGTVEVSHDDHGDKHETELQYTKPEKWEIDHKKPKVFSYADEFLLKPIFIRSYHQRSKVLSVLKTEFEKAAKMYEHGHHDEGHGHGDHGHGDHGHGDHGHGHEGHGHGNEEQDHAEEHHTEEQQDHMEKHNDADNTNGKDSSVVVIEDIDAEVNDDSDHVL